MITASQPWVMAVKAVIADAEGRQLLLRRSSACRTYQGFWEWPGGKLDPGEPFADGLTREVREECGLEVEFTRLAGSSEFDMPTYISRPTAPHLLAFYPHGLPRIHRRLVE